MRYCNGVNQKGFVDCDTESGQCEICYLADLEDEVESLRSDSARYQWLRKVTPYRFKKIQDASVTDGGDVLYFHADRFDELVDAAQ